MARRKREQPDGGSRRGSNPGAYVQVTGERTRKSSANHAALSDGSTVGAVERVGPSVTKYQPERGVERDEGREEPMVERVFQAPRRAHGPLGMDMESREAPSNRDHLKRTALGIGPQLAFEPARETEPKAPERVRSPSQQRVRVLEINAVSADSDETHHHDHGMRRDKGDREPEARARPSAPLVARESAFEDASEARFSHPSAPMDGFAEPFEARSTSVPPSSVPPSPREQFAGVLDARPSLRASDPVQTPRGPSWSMVVGVAMLSSIIAAAGVVALQETFGRGREPAVVEAPTSSVTKGAATGAEPTTAAPTPTPAPTQAVAELAPPAGQAPSTLELAAPSSAEQAAALTPEATGEAQELGATTPAPSEPEKPADIAKAEADKATTEAPNALEATRAAAVAPSTKFAPGAREQTATVERRSQNRVLAGGLVAPGEKGESPGGANDPLPSNPYE